MRSSEKAKEHWNDTPLHYSEEYRYAYYPWLYGAAEFSKHAGDRVLEVGCGTGSDLLQFGKHGAIATGVDVTPKHLELARERVGNLAKVVEADATSLPFPDESFNYCYSHGVLHHIENPQKAVDEILRILKPGGRFNIHLYAKYSYFPLYLMLRFGRRWKYHIENSTVPVHIDLYTSRSVSKLFPVKVQIHKEQCPIQFLAPVFGWYLIVTGNKS